jgi:hypothetical protein
MAVQGEVPADRAELVERFASFPGRLGRRRPGCR